MRACLFISKLSGKLVDMAAALRLDDEEKPDDEDDVE
jgi:hypothetical protein